MVHVYAHGFNQGLTPPTPLGVEVAWFRSEWKVIGWFQHVGTAALDGRFLQVVHVDGNREVNLLLPVVLLTAYGTKHFLLDVLSAHRELVLLFGLLNPCLDVFWIVALDLLALTREIETAADNLRYSKVAGIIGHFKLPVIEVFASGILLFHGKRNAACSL